MAKRRKPASAPRDARYYRDRAAKLRRQAERKAIRTASKGKETPKEIGAAQLYPGFHVSDRLLELIERQADQNRIRRSSRSSHDPFKIHWGEFPPSCRPPADVQLAMDENLSWASAQWASGGPLGMMFAEGLAFPGYPYLSELFQRPEYRTAIETLSGEMVRKWIKLSGRGKGKPGSKEHAESAGKKTRDKAERIKELEEFLNSLGIRNAYKTWAAHDFGFGRGHLFHEFDDNDASTPAGLAEVRSEIGDPAAPPDSRSYKLAKLKCSPSKPLTGLRCIEPVWTYPTTYNATNPLRRDWYHPKIWYTMGQEIHISRLFLLIGQPVPDLMKPSYSFGGISLSQLGQPSVNIWLETRASIGRLIHAFSTMVLKTDLQTTLQPGGEAALMRRVALFNAMRDNNQTFILNNDTEDFANVAVPLSGLEGLQAQAQEHMCSVWRIPTAVYTGISPTGLNASSEGEIRIFENTIHGMQEMRWRHPLAKTIAFGMLSLWGEVDHDIVFDFNPLREMTEKEEAEINKLKAETDDLLVNGVNALRPEEVRMRVATDPDSGYENIDPDDMPEPPEMAVDPETGEPTDPAGSVGAKPGARLNISGHEAFAGKAKVPPKKAANDMARDAGWNESDHPRAPDGKFGAGGGSPVHVVAKANEWGKPIILGAHGTAAGAAKHRAEMHGKEREQHAYNMGEPPNEEEWRQHASSNPHRIASWHAGTGGVGETGETHVVATGEHDAEEGGATGRVKIHGTYATRKEAESAANTVAKSTWEVHGPLYESDEGAWADEEDRILREWNAGHGTGFNAESKDMPADLQKEINGISDRPLPYPGLKKAIAYWRKANDVDHLVPIIKQLQMGEA